MSDAREPAPGVRARPRPIEKFLGAQESRGGPFAILGISPAACTDDLVLSALDRQVDRVDRHPECDTPEADEVRLALHAAAAQLLDPVVRRHLIGRWTGKPVAAAPAAGRAPTPRATPAPAPTPARPIAAARSPEVSERVLEADAILAMGLYGGWNQRSLRRLLALAHARGFTTSQVAATVRALGRQKRSRTKATAARPKADAPRPPHRPVPSIMPSGPRAGATPPPERGAVYERVEDHADPGQEILRKALLFGGVGLVLMAGAVAAIILATSTGGGPPATPQGAAVGNPAPAAPVPIPSPISARQTPELPAKPEPSSRPQVDLAQLVREFASCAQGVVSDPDAAADRFEQAVALIGSSWVDLPRDRLIACHDSIVEFVYKAGQSDAAMRAVTSIARGASPLAGNAPLGHEAILPGAWSVGVMVRLGRERDLSAGVKSVVDAALGSSLGPGRASTEPTFEAGVVSALLFMPHRLTPVGPSAQGGVDPAAWASWAEGAEAVGAWDRVTHQRILLSGLEILLVDGPEPNADRNVAAVVGQLVQRLTWRSADESRRWLMRWFNDRRISEADLHAVTSSLATRSAAEGVDLTMVLSTAASENARAALRDRYATVWSMQDAVNRDALAAAWAEAAGGAVESSFVIGDDAQELYHAVILARLSEAAMWQWRGHGEEAARLVSDLTTPVEQAMQQPARTVQERFASASDGAWGEKYLAARGNIKVRRDLLEQIPDYGTTLGPVDAEVLVGEAFFGSPVDLRALAAARVQRNAESPAVVNGILERLPRIPRTSGTTAIIEAVVQRPLPSARDPAWPIVARRYLVEKLLENIATESPLARVDRLARLLGISYRAMAADAVLAPDLRAANVQPPAYVSAAQVWQRWRVSAGSVVPTTPPPLLIEQVERRRAGRLSQANGMIQLFAAQQVSIAEMMAYIVNAEQPSRAEEIRLILSQMADDRRRASTIPQQIKAAERAIVQLWMIRFQEDPA